jgi:hypothetical protein
MFYFQHSQHMMNQTGCGVNPVSYPMGTGGSFLGLMQPGREADHSPPSSTEVTIVRCYTSASQSVSSWRGA